MTLSELDTPLTQRLSGATPKKLLEKGINTVGDLMHLAPRRYDHWGELTSIACLREGEEVTIFAEVLSQKLHRNRSRGGVRLQVELTDGTNVMTTTFFASNGHRLAPHIQILHPGATILFAGKVGVYRGQLQLINPQFEGSNGKEVSDLYRQRNKPIPIYPSVGGLTSWALRRAILMLLESLGTQGEGDPIPLNIRDKHQFPDLLTTFRWLHSPEDDSQWKASRRSLAWREALVLQTGLAFTRSRKNTESAFSCPQVAGGFTAQLVESLPFSLTESQNGAIGEIREDLSRAHPMQRLLQGDVGSGKTVVALAGMCQVIEAGHQVAMLVPTEILAEQHAQSLRKLLQPLPWNTPSQGNEPDLLDDFSADVTQSAAGLVHVLTASSSRATKVTLEKRLSAGEPLIVIGTHALLEDTVHFTDLGLVVIDEQHRFGVSQRDKLRQGMATVPHQLVMTATPIPRTVAMTVFGDLDETSMEGLPPGRRPVETYLIDNSNRVWVDRVWIRAKEEIDRGGRVYVVCPRIDEADTVSDVGDEENDPILLEDHTGKEERQRPNLAAKMGQYNGNNADKKPLASVVTVAQQLRDCPALAGVSLAELTGRVNSSEKNAIMDDFVSGITQLLVATTVIEVGVDVPEATMMVIVDAQQFGLSQLHQLRGRVGRSQSQSVCLAIHPHELSTLSMSRLRAFASTTNGFELAKHDLELRREGDVLGSDQSGRMSGLRFLSVSQDSDIIESARHDAQELVRQDKDLSYHRELRETVIRRLDTDVAWLERS